MPRERPFKALSHAQLAARFETALRMRGGPDGAHCIHELWMRGEFVGNIEAALERLWREAAATIPEWLPMQYVSWLAAGSLCVLLVRWADVGSSLGRRSGSAWLR